MAGHSNENVTLTVPGADPSLYNADLAPTAPAGRTWKTFDIFSMWMSDVHSVGGYTFAASLFFLGLSGWQVLIAMTVGIVIVYFLMNLIGRPSQVLGIPYPVFARVSFGVRGANLAALVRGVVGVVWYGVQTGAGAGAHVLSGRAGADAFRICRTFGIGLVLLFIHVVFPAGDLSQRHGDDPQVHRFLRPGGLSGDVNFGRLDFMEGGIFRPFAVTLG
jgi:hypothetical protein